MCLNARILRNIDVLSTFGYAFLTKLTYIFHQETFASDDPIIEEGHLGTELYFLVSGRAIAYSRKDMTFFT